MIKVWMAFMKSAFVKKYILAIAGLFSLGCDAADSSNGDSIINAGAFFVTGSDLIAPAAGVGYIAVANQPLLAHFTVYAGAIPGFAEEWDKVAPCNPGFGKFAIHRIITDETEKWISDEYIVLEDFPNDDKYLMYYTQLADDPTQSFVEYTWCTVDTVDFASIDLDSGQIYYTLGYYDDVKGEPYRGNVYCYGVQSGRILKFEKRDSRVIFSLQI